MRSSLSIVYLCWTVLGCQRPSSEAVVAPGYDDPATEERWCNEQRVHLSSYLVSQGVGHGNIGDWPAWHVPPHVAIWAIESLARPGWIGWWGISGDLPTDHISAADVEPPQHPRKAMRVIAGRWLALVAAWKDGREDEDLSIESTLPQGELGPLLEAR